MSAADDGGLSPTAVLVGIFGLLGAALLLRLRRLRSRVTATTPLDDDVEAELQKLIADQGRRKAGAAERTEQRSTV